MHWMCLENNNHQMWWCRQPEKALNKCVFDKLVRKSIRSTGDELLITDIRVWRRRFLERMGYLYIFASHRHSHDGSREFGNKAFHCHHLMSTSCVASKVS